MDDALAEMGACPCGSGLPYSGCCQPVHSGDPALTAEALMRSRFSAFALGLRDYLLLSWHSSTRVAGSSFFLDPDVEWRRLQIVDTVAGGPDDQTGIVEFRASYRSRADPSAAGVQHERSRFSREADEWRYLDGDVTGKPVSAPAPSR